MVERNHMHIINAPFKHVMYVFATKAMPAFDTCCVIRRNVTSPLGPEGAAHAAFVQVMAA